jgi:hypothetical protein
MTFIPPTHYVITCPDCRGRLFIAGVLCPTCDGNGRLFIPERTTGHRVIALPLRALRITFLVALAIGVIIALAVTR